MSAQSIISSALSAGVLPSYISSYDLAYQISPIILVGGIAADAVGGMLPIIALLGQSAPGLLSQIAGVDNSPRFVPIPGGTIISSAVGTYPFANQQVAGNAIIQQPLNISLLMHAPVRDVGGYLDKLSMFTALQNSLQAHNNAGGTYNIATPAFIYTDCVMTTMQDVTSGETKQQQVQWQLDFVKPLITLQQAAAAFNSLMGKVSSGAQVTTPNWSGGDSTSGTPAQNTSPNFSGVTGSVITFPTGPQ